MKRQFLFLLFTDEQCRLNHAFMYAIDLHKSGYEVKIIIEGAATQCFNRLAEGGKFTELFNEARDTGLIAGACKTASGGCSTGDASRNVADIAAENKIKMLSALSGHAAIEPFISEGYEVLVF
ncbi:MAG: hypothetical protein NTX59_06270 [Elusimicrobia bacterium]|nr:hypothetical protein [Elusimicrobiota bacterium]